jgi:PAS domain S-box-containing protein
MTKPEKDLRILVIEDNPGDFELVEDFILEKIDVAIVTHAGSFKEAKEKFSLIDFPFDVVLLDLSLPDKFGEALIKEITDLCVDKPIIVLTGYSDVDFGVKSLSLGITDYLLKDELTALSLYKSIIYSIERKKNIADLEQSEREYSELFHLSPQPMWVFDIKTLNFLDVNEAAISHYGYTRQNFLDMTMRDIRPENEVENLENALAYFTASQPKNFQGVFNHRKKDGSIIQVEIRCNGITYRGKQANLILINDVTERLKYKGTE